MNNQQIGSSVSYRPFHITAGTGRYTQQADIQQAQSITPQQSNAHLNNNLITERFNYYLNNFNEALNQAANDHSDAAALNVDNSLNLLSELIVQYPAVILFRDQDYRSHYASYAAAKCPKEVRAFFELNNSSLKRLSGLSILIQKQIFDKLRQFSTSVTGWNSEQAEKIENLISIAESHQDFSYLLTNSFYRAPEVAQILISELLNKHQFNLATSLINLCDSYPQNEQLASLLRDVAFIKETSERCYLLQNIITSFTQIQALSPNIIPQNYDRWTLINLYNKHENFFVFLKQKTFSTQAQIDCLVKQKILELLKEDFEYAQEFAITLLEHPSICDDQGYFILQNINLQQLIMLKNAVLWLNKTSKEPYNRQQLLNVFKTLVLFSLKNSEIAKSLLTIPVSEIFYVHEFLANCANLAEINLNHLQDFLNLKKNQGINITIDFATDAINSQNVYQSIKNFIKRFPDAEPHFHGWLNKVLIGTTPSTAGPLTLEAKVQLLPYDDLCVAFRISKIPSHQLEIVKFAENAVYRERILKLIDHVIHFPRSGSYLLTISKSHPHLLIHLINLFEKIKNIETIDMILAKSRSIDFNLFERLLKIHNLPTDFFIDVLGWMTLSPLFVDKWIYLAERGLVLPIGKVPPKLIDHLIHDGNFLKKQLILNKDSFPVDFWNVYDKNEMLAYKLLNITSSYPMVFKSLCHLHAYSQTNEYSTIYNHILDLNINNPQHSRVINGLLFLLEDALNFKCGNAPEMFEYLAMLIDAEEFDLLERLLDMAKITEPMDMLVLLKRKDLMDDEDESFVQLCLREAGSKYGKTIGTLIQISDEWNQGPHLINLFKDETKTHQYLNIAHYLFNYCENIQFMPTSAVPAEKNEGFSNSNIKENIIYESNSSKYTDNQIDNISAKTTIPTLQIIENYHKSQTPRNRTLYEALNQGDFAFVEFIIDRPLSRWDAHSRLLQEALWELHDTFGQDHSTIEYCLRIAEQSVEDKEIHEFISLLLFFEAATKKKVSVDNSSKTFKEKYNLVLFYFNKQIDTLVKHVRERTAQENLIHSESLDEMVFSKELAKYLLTSKGRINKGIISLLKNNKAFMLKLSQQGSYGKHLETALNWLESDFLNISDLIARLKAPIDPDTPQYKLLASMTNLEKKCEDRTAQQALLSALLTRLRQHPLRGSCFATAFAIETQSTYTGFVRSAQEYRDLIQFGLLTIKEKNSTFVYTHELVFENDSIDANPLARAREYTIAQSATVEVSEFTLLLIKQKNAVFAERLNSICQKLSSPHLYEEILVQMSDSFCSIIDNAYLPDMEFPLRKERGAWCLERRDSRQKISSSTEYLQLIIDVGMLAKAKLCERFQDQTQTLNMIFILFEEDLLNNHEIILNEITNFYQKNFDNRYQKFHSENSKISPWITYSGGYDVVTKREYYKNRSASSVKINNNNPEMSLRNLLMYGRELPTRIKQEVQANERPLIVVGIPNHTCNIDAAQLINVLRDENAISLIENLKIEALHIRAQKIPMELIYKIKHAISSLLPSSQAIYFLQSLDVMNIEISTIAHLADLIFFKAHEIFGSLESFHRFCATSENILRSLLTDNGYVCPKIISILDLNYRANNHASVYLGYGFGLLTLEVLEFYTFSNNREPKAIQKNNFKSERFRLNHALN